MCGNNNNHKNNRGQEEIFGGDGEVMAWIVVMVSWYILIFKLIKFL